MGRDLSQDASAPPDPRGPRWGTDRALATRITRRGRWGKIDPLLAGRAPTIWEVAGFAAWLGLVVGAIRKASRAVAAEALASDAETPAPDTADA